MNQHRQNITLFSVSFLILFLEIALIRWISTEIRIFAYLQNLVLLACFIGSGLGCYLWNKKIRLYISAVTLGLIILFITLPLYFQFYGQWLHLFCSTPIFLASFEDTVIIYQRTIQHLPLMQALGASTTLLMFFCIVLTFVPLGQLLGYIFENNKNTIQAYSINIAGSLTGVLVFNALSFFYTPPWVWWLITIVFLGLLMFLFSKLQPQTNATRSRQERWKNIAAMGLSLVAVGYMISNSPITLANKLRHGMTVWSPYQKLTLAPLMTHPGPPDPFTTPTPIGYSLATNNVNFMNLMNLTQPFLTIAKTVLKDPMYQSQPDGELNRFTFPFILKKDAKSVLIMGGGAGNDAAGAVRAGLEKIDVVEIDPGIYDLGVKYHPEHPYTNPKVRVFVDDARSFLKKSKEKYDVILLGLLDAHAQSATMNSMRMDHYVYTEESFKEMKKLLKEDGLLVVHFWVHRIWIGKRVENIMTSAIGWQPAIFSMGEPNGKGPIMLLSGHTKQNLADIINQNSPEIKFHILTHRLNYTQPSRNTTDDWPYFYLRTPSIPSMHLCMIGILVVLLLLSYRLLLQKGQRLQLHFFFLGAAFLLLEFQNINKASLLFGMTWIVSALNISAILFLILMANLVVYRFRITNIKAAYLLLFSSLVINFLIPLDVYNQLPYIAKCISASFVLNLPVFFAGIVFIISFSKTPNKSLAFGSNLIGSVVGGMLESLSFVVGIKLIIVLTMILYGLSLLNRK